MWSAATDELPFTYIRLVATVDELIVSEAAGFLYSVLVFMVARFS